jgi:putative ABC transport system permease protein
LLVAEGMLRTGVIAVPWSYLVAVAGLSAGALVAVGAAEVRLARRPPIPILREL